MVRFSVQKLVRDRIPLVIEDDRVLIQTVPLENDAAFLDALTHKLIEEAYEVKESQHHELIEELADVKEVMDEIMRLRGITLEQLQQVQDQKRETRGGFTERLFITYLDAPKDSKAYEYCIKYPKKYPIVPEE